MLTALNIYATLLIGFTSVVAPLILYLLSIHSEGIAVKRRQFEEYEKQTNALLREKINSSSEENNLREYIDEDARLFNKKKQENREQLDLLDPKKQIRRIFSPLFWSIVSLCIVMFLTDGRIFKSIWDSEYHKIFSIYAVTIAIFFGNSLIQSISAIIRLKDVTWAIIDIKQDIAKENDKVKNKPDRVIQPSQKENK